jgi:hypothetical protein
MANLVLQPLRVILQRGGDAVARCVRWATRWLRKPVSANKPDAAATEPHWLPFD